MNGATFMDNSATMNGGAIYDTAGLVLSSGTFTGNSAANFGGAIDVTGSDDDFGRHFLRQLGLRRRRHLYTPSSSSITNATLSGNSATMGGAVANASTGNLDNQQSDLQR